MQFVSGRGNHLPRIRAHAASDSPDPPWPMRRRGLGENWTTIAFLSKEALGLRLVPEHSFGSQNVAFRSAFFAVSEIRPSWVPPQLTKWVVAGACANQAFYCRITPFSLKENMFGVGLRPRRPPTKQQGPRSQRQPRPSLANAEERAR